MRHDRTVQYLHCVICKHHGPFTKTKGIKILWKVSTHTERKINVNRLDLTMKYFKDKTYQYVCSCWSQHCSERIWKRFPYIKMWKKKMKKIWHWKTKPPDKWDSVKRRAVNLSTSYLNNITYSKCVRLLSHSTHHKKILSL